VENVVFLYKNNYCS